jgi:hypothetical protein
MPNPDRPGLALLQILFRCKRGIHALNEMRKHHFGVFVKKISCSDGVKHVSERTWEAIFVRIRAVLNLNAVLRLGRGLARSVKMAIRRVIFALYCGSLRRPAAVL